MRARDWKDGFPKAAEEIFAAPGVIGEVAASRQLHRKRKKLLNT